VTHDQFEVLSNQAVAACAVVYFLALLAHLAQWAVERKVPVTAPAPARSRAVPAAVGAGDLVPAAASYDVPDAGAEGADEDVAEEKADRFGRIGLALTIVAVVVHLVSVVSRGLAADPARVPWGNMYEFTLTGTFVVAAGYLLLYRKFSLSWLAPVVTGFVLVTLMADVLLLYSPVTPLRDALQSPWLIIHVVAAIIATGAFTIGGMASVLYLLKERWLARGGAEQAGRRGYLARLPGLEALDRVAYRTQAFAFPVWTFAALIAGPIWAKHAWGSYWSWDPKEVWAFITWVVYAAYLHARATAGWKGRAAAIVALVGLATLWFNFIGINFFFGQGSMHSYA
jgi:cytochrome c-type biogenesis protein CcsB